MGKTALLVIDMQMAMTHRTEAGRPRANPEAEVHAAALLALFRGRGLPVVHVHHDDPDTESPFHSGAPGQAQMPCAQPIPGEAVFWKTTSSGFAGTGLEAHLRAQGIDRLVIIGGVAGFCVTSTTRSASDLGFAVILPGDAVIGFDVPAPGGGKIDPDTVLRVTLGLLGAGFADVVTSAEVAGLLDAA